MRFCIVAEDVLRVRRRFTMPGQVPVRVLERDGGDEVDEVDEPRKVFLGDLEADIVLIQNILELRVLLLYRLQRVVDELAGGGDFVGFGRGSSSSSAAMPSARNGPTSPVTTRSTSERSLWVPLAREPNRVAVSISG